MWKPREGREENAIEGWLERIRLVTGQSARVIIVATHCSERHPELNYPDLESKYGDILAGQCRIDSSDGTGIDELKQRIADVAAELSGIGTPVNPNWVKARDAVLARNDARISYNLFRKTCTDKQYGLTDEDARTLAVLLARQGHIVYHDIDGLRDYVVLKPEWLTKAISYVLEDGPTRERQGVLLDDDLERVWLTHGEKGRAKYPKRYHPYFVAMMERYDVSYRLPKHDHTEPGSLVAQLVPYETPENLPWRPGESVGERRELSFICDMDVDPPGLVPWTIVRNHRWNGDQLHWREGVFLVHEDGHEAHVAFNFRRRELRITVRGAYPSHFLTLLRDGLEHLIRERWPHLGFEEFMQCPGMHGNSCDGRFNIKNLNSALASGVSMLQCHACRNNFDVAEILHGYRPAGTDVHQGFAQLRAQIKEEFVKAGVKNEEAFSLAALQRAQLADRHSKEIQRLAAQSAEMIRRVLRAIADEAHHGPRLFTIAPRSASKWNPKNWGQETLRLTLWCEHPGHEHPCGNSGRFEINQPGDWLRKLGPYIALAAKAMRVIVPVSAGLAGLTEDAVRDEIKPELDFMEKVVKYAMPEMDEPKSVRAEPNDRVVSQAEGDGLRTLHTLLDQVAGDGKRGDLRRVVSKNSGDVLWVCKDHYREYEPGLPKLGNS